MGDGEQVEEGQGWSWKTGSPEKKARMEEFIEWCLTPDALRVYPSKQKLADSMGVHVNTLRNYQKEPKFQQEVAARARALARVDRLPEILESLYDQAVDRTNSRSVSAARLLLDFTQVAEEETSKVDPKDLSQEQLVEVALEILHKAQGEPATV